MKHLRHALYYGVAGITFLPYSAGLLIGVLSEKFFNVMMKFRRWCFSDQYRRWPKNG